MALLARFVCGCVKRVDIPAPPTVTCDAHGAKANLMTLPNGSVRYQAAQPRPVTDEAADAAQNRAPH